MQLAARHAVTLLSLAECGKGKFKRFGLPSDLLRLHVGDITAVLTSHFAGGDIETRRCAAVGAGEGCGSVGLGAFGDGCKDGDARQG